MIVDDRIVLIEQTAQVWLDRSAVWLELKSNLAQNSWPRANQTRILKEEEYKYKYKSLFSFSSIGAHPFHLVRVPREKAIEWEADPLYMKREFARLLLGSYFLRIGRVFLNRSLEPRAANSIK